MKIIDFYTNWCGPCKILSKIIDEIKIQRPEIIIEKIDITEDSKGYDIKSVPTLFFLDDNDNILEKHIGLISKDKIYEIIDKHK